MPGCSFRGSDHIRSVCRESTGDKSGDLGEAGEMPLEAVGVTA
jgi:hypothetical protein